MPGTKLMWMAMNGDLEGVIGSLGMVGERNGIGETALMWTAANDHPNCIPILEEEVGLQADDGWTALMLATLSGHERCVRLLLSEAGKQTTKEWNDFPPGTTALMIAAHQNHSKIVDILLPYEQGLNDSEGHTAKWYANNNNPKGKDFTEVRKFLEIEGRNRIPPPSKGPLMFLAYAMTGNVEGILRTLDYVGYRDLNGTTALMLAAEGGHAGCVRLLEGEIGMQDDNGMTALMKAAMKGHSNCVSVLECESEMQNNDGWTALMLAAYRGHADCAQLLLPEVGKQSIKEQNGFPSRTTALMIAVNQNHSEIVELLLPYEQEMKDNYGRTSLMYAAREGHINCIPLLENELGTQSNNGWTALMWAAYYGNTDCARLLLSEVGRQTTMNWGIFLPGTTALMLAAQYNHPEIVELLLPYEQGLKDNSGNTALMMAASHGRPASVRLLLPLEGGLFNNQKETALLLALQEGRVECAKLLIDEAAICDEDGRMHIGRIRGRAWKEQRADSLLSRTYRAVADTLEEAVRRQIQKKRLEALSPHHILALLSPIERSFEQSEALELGEMVWSALLCEPGALGALDDAFCKVEDEIIDGCVVCLSRQKDAILLPCRHLVICEVCADQIEHRCPYCRRKTDEVIVVECAKEQGVAISMSPSPI
ncbi:Ankyrin repeat protein 2 [Giardia muris]|uniref:Ankyrin repeat protein 2 n=1 Tax=Giardia muris TaxID=5742 RepID=A0A4Z1T4T7_GIAMU|nr:Ankyrin repeat protein 2 [Giardia muris]|eukprot:TNJ27539.1 Ankyrin repeat protein 2 [Giardia muris]